MPAKQLPASQQLILDELRKGKEVAHYINPMRGSRSAYWFIFIDGRSRRCTAQIKALLRLGLARIVETSSVPGQKRIAVPAEPNGPAGGLLT